MNHYVTFKITFMCVFCAGLLLFFFLIWNLHAKYRCLRYSHRFKLILAQNYVWWLLWTLVRKSTCGKMTNSHIVHALQIYRKDETVENSPPKHHRAHSVGDSHYRFTFAYVPLYLNVRSDNSTLVLLYFWLWHSMNTIPKQKNCT